MTLNEIHERLHTLKNYVDTACTKPIEEFDVHGVVEQMTGLCIALGSIEPVELNAKELSEYLCSYVILKQLRAAFQRGEEMARAILESRNSTLN